MIHPILAGDVIREHHRELLREAQSQRLMQHLIGNRPSWPAWLRPSAILALAALRKPIPERRAAVQPAVLCDCYID
ncbi:MAG TPA: hypothetical protein VFU22_32665 [Roseiflexaceae bacterium]|nr:hypothetical protein [Roseiflexaceae bacterium]